MRVMNDSNFNYARVLNLSDLRTPKSPVLYKFLKSEKSSLVAHSIFDAKRKADLDELFVHNVPVIFGWGVNKSLTCLAKQAIQSIKCDNPIGLKKNDSDVAYYHPLPRVYSDQIEWVNAINGMLAAHRKRCRNQSKNKIVVLFSVSKTILQPQPPPQNQSLIADSSAGAFARYVAYAPQLILALCGAPQSSCYAITDVQVDYASTQGNSLFYRLCRC